MSHTTTQLLTYCYTHIDRNINTFFPQKSSASTPAHLDTPCESHDRVVGSCVMQSGVEDIEVQLPVWHLASKLVNMASVRLLSTVVFTACIGMWPLYGKSCFLSTFLQNIVSANGNTCVTLHWSLWWPVVCGQTLAATTGTPWHTRPDWQTCSSQVTSSTCHRSLHHSVSSNVDYWLSS